MVLLIRIVQVNFAWQFIQSKILFGGYMVYETMCWEDTFNLGKKIGQQAKPGQVICLNGDLGVGTNISNVTSPATTNNKASTVANIGRSMKNFENIHYCFLVVPLSITGLIFMP